jgi:hypothetical protein
VLTSTITVSPAYNGSNLTAGIIPYLVPLSVLDGTGSYVSSFGGAGISSGILYSVVASNFPPGRYFCSYNLETGPAASGGSNYSDRDTLYTYVGAGSTAAGANIHMDSTIRPAYMGASSNTYYSGNQAGLVTITNSNQNIYFSAVLSNYQGANLQPVGSVTGHALTFFNPTIQKVG